MTLVIVYVAKRRYLGTSYGMNNLTELNISEKEEVANVVTHGIGALLAMAALIILIVSRDILATPGYLIYGISLVILYLISTLYHSLTHPGAKNIFRKLDHMAIFLLIAGTYTPFCLETMSGWIGWTLLTTVWILAIAGILVKYFYNGIRESLSLIFYVVSGWMAIVAIKPIYEVLSATGFTLLIAGGVAYTIGTYFYMSNRIRYGHSIWHLWVIAGSALHFFSILTLTP